MDQDKGPVRETPRRLRCVLRELRRGEIRERGGRVLLGEWRWAYLGCTLLDVVRLTDSLVARNEAVLGIGLSRVFGALVDRKIGTEELRAAELLERVVSRYVRD